MYKNMFIVEWIVELEMDDCLIWLGSEEVWLFSEVVKLCLCGYML